MTAERLGRLQFSNGQAIPPESSLNLNVKRRIYPENAEYEQEYEEVEEEYEDGEKTSYTSSTATPHSRCSKGVSTDEREESQTHKASHPPSSDKKIIINDNMVNNDDKVKSHSKRFGEQKDRVGDGSGPSRNSALLHLIACGSLVAVKAKSAIVGSSDNGDGVRRSESVERTAMGDADMIKCMSENPRFGNLQSEEKEYFSGGIVESMSKIDREIAAYPALKKSNSFNEEEFRSNKVGAGEGDEEERKKKAAGKGKCIPLIKSCTSSNQCRG